ncbi:MAG: DNA polymerase I [Actinomycetota bacterium]
MGPLKGKLLLLDGHSLAYRAFYALPESLTTSSGQPTNAVYGFTTMLIRLLVEEQPDAIAVALDLPTPTFRVADFAQYKAQRAAAPDQFRSQIGLIREVLATLRIPVVEAPGFEADDVIATLATQAGEAGYEVLIVTGDRDTLQLVDSSTRVMMTRRGVTDTLVYDVAGVRERYGVLPEQYPDLAALRGDVSDNIPGVPGVGDKTAAKLVAEYGSVEELYGRLDEVKGKLAAVLREHREDVARNKRLARLVRDVPLEVGADDLKMGEWDREEVRRVFDTLEFRTLRERLFAGVKGAMAPEVGFTMAARRLAPGGMAAFLRGTRGRLGLAPELRTRPGSATLDGLALADPEGGAVWASLDAASPDDLEALRAFLADSSRPKAVHDAKVFYLAAWERGWELAGLEIDTALVAYLALPAQRTYDLADLAGQYLNKELKSDAASSEGQLSLEGDSGWTDHCLRAQAVVELAAVLEARLQGWGLSRLLGEVELPLVEVLARMEWLGLAVDTGVLGEIEDRLDQRMRTLEVEIWRHAGEEFNVNSNPQLQQVLFEKLRLRKTKRIKTGYTTDAGALAGLIGTHPIIEAILGYRELSKLVGTYVQALPPLVQADGRIHPQYNQMIAATGRLSSSNPNVQNIPVRTEEGREIRRAFVPGPGFEGLLTADYSQIELRVLAHLAEDEDTIAAFEAGEDFHRVSASMVFGVPAEQVDSELRRRMKAFNYGLAYGLSAYGLAQQLGIAPDEARGLMDAYFSRFHKIKAYLDSVVEDARRQGYTETILGRRRYLPDLVSASSQLRQVAERMALNAPIQGSAADLIKMAMLRVQRSIEEGNLDSRMVLQVHDELLFEVAPGERERLEDLVRREMEGVFSLRPALRVETGYGKSWAEAAH